MALDSTGSPYFVFVDACATPTRVRLAFYKTGAWTVQDVDTVDSDRPSIVLDASDHPNLCYFDRKNSTEKYAAWDGKAWFIDKVDTYSGGDCAIALDKGGRVSIAYVDYAHRVRYATSQSAAGSHPFYLPFIHR